jgi:hypothetical protein
LLVLEPSETYKSSVRFCGLGFGDSKISIHALIEKHLIRCENINGVKTYFLSFVGLRLTYDNLKKLSVQPMEFALASGEIEQSSDSDS